MKQCAIGFDVFRAGRSIRDDNATATGTSMTAKSMSHFEVGKTIIPSRTIKPEKLDGHFRSS